MVTAYLVSQILLWSVVFVYHHWTSMDTQDNRLVSGAAITLAVLPLAALLASLK